ncbi:alpha/beta hydrolase [Candidatus Saccharibacteria bacterium]|nr:alpha/beta hydrolase [Candidatus Saccharibacteria bacterium]
MGDAVVKKNIPTGVSDIVIFVHGFGVRWDSRGMFTDIKKYLPPEWGSVLFDLYEVKNNEVYVSSYKDQIEQLNKIIDKVSKNNPNIKIHIIAHSMGCTITASAEVSAANGKIIFLAPAELFGSKMEKYFEEYPGVIKNDKELIIHRKDGTKTHIPIGFFSEIRNIDPQEEILKLSKNHMIDIVQTKKDEVIGETAYKDLRNSDNISFQSIESDHNFTGANREKLLTKVGEMLK